MIWHVICKYHYKYLRLYNLNSRRYLLVETLLFLAKMDTKKRLYSSTSTYTLLDDWKEEFHKKPSSP